MTFFRSDLIRSNETPQVKTLDITGSAVVGDQFLIGKDDNLVFKFEHDLENARSILYVGDDGADEESTDESSFVIRNTNAGIVRLSGNVRASRYLDATKNGALNIPDSTATTITAWTANLNEFSTLTPNPFNATNGTFTAPADAVYEVTATVTMTDGATTGDRVVGIYVNDVAVASETHPGIDGTLTLTLAKVLSLEKDDVVTIKVTQDSGDTITVDATAGGLAGATCFAVRVGL